MLKKQKMFSMEKQEKNFLKTMPNATVGQSAEKDRQELLLKLSSVVVYNLLRVKDKTTSRAAMDLRMANAQYKSAYAAMEELTNTIGLILDEKLVINYIRDELGIKSKQQNINVDVQEEALLNSLKIELGEHSEPIAKVLLEVSRKAYGHMGERDTIHAAHKLIHAIEKQSDIGNLPYIIKNALLATLKINERLSTFIQGYSRYRSGVQKLDVYSIMEKAIGQNEEAILRTSSSIMSDYLSNEAMPSWPRIIIEKSIEGKSVGFQMNWEKRSGYFSIVYLKPKDYNLIASFVVQINEIINEAYLSRAKSSEMPKLSVIPYSDLGVCMIGCPDFPSEMLDGVKSQIRRLFGGN